MDFQNFLIIQKKKGKDKKNNWKVEIKDHTSKEWQG